MFREAICTVSYSCSCLRALASQQRMGLDPTTITGSSRANELAPSLELEIPNGRWVCRTDSCQYMKHRHTCLVKPCGFFAVAKIFLLFRELQSQQTYNYSNLATTFVNSLERSAQVQVPILIATQLKINQQILQITFLIMEKALEAICGLWTGVFEKLILQQTT